MSDMVASRQTEPDDHTARMHPGAQPTFWRSMVHAVHGVRHVVRHERNARIHLCLAVAAVVASLALRLSAVQWTAVLFAIIVVFLAEIFNTAIERTLDLIDVHENPHIKLIKDMTAGAVLIAAVAAAIIGLVIFGPAAVRFIWGS
jgi:diacylglycerol kinase